jgi:hypothetical protein
VVAWVAAVAVLVGVVVARIGLYHAASSRPGSLPSASSPAAWPSAAGACGWPVYLPQSHLARHHADVYGKVLVGGTGLRQVTLGHAVSRPLSGMPDHGQLVTKLVAGPDADYAVDVPCSSSGSSLRVYRIAAGAAHRLNTAADDLLGGPRRAWAVSYLAQHTVLTALAGGRVVTLKPGTSPFADTAAGLVVVAHHGLPDLPDTLELIDPTTGALRRRLAEATPLGAAGHLILVSLPDCGALLTHRTCTLESIDLTTGLPTASFELSAGRAPISDAVFSPDGTKAAFQLARASQDPRFTTGWPSRLADVVVLHLHTGRLDIVPGLELPPLTWAGLAFDATGRWLLTTVSEGERGELLAWRQGMPGPALVTTLPGPLATDTPLLRTSSPAAQQPARPGPGTGRHQAGHLLDPGMSAPPHAISAHGEGGPQLIGHVMQGSARQNARGCETWTEAKAADHQS